MVATAVTLLFLSPVILFTLWHYISTISPPPIPESLYNKKIVLLIAHPDDESMFFSPTLQALTDPSLGNHVKILCFSTGDSDGLGETRRLELQKAAVVLGIRQKEDVFVMNDPRFRDGMREEWSDTEIAKVLAQAFAPQLLAGSQTPQRKAPAKDQKPSKGQGQSTSSDYRELQRAQSDGPQATIDILLTFDSVGISDHPNHKSLYHGSKLFLQQIMKGYSGYSCPVALYTLTSTNVIRKYIFLLDLLPTYIVRLYTSIFGGSGINAPAGRSRQVRKDDTAVFVNSITKYMKAREAMVKGHQSQMVWFRWGWISLGRYMVMNDVRREYAHT